MSILYVVATPIGNLNDTSKRMIEVLSSCDLILAEDTRHTVKLTNHFNIKTKLMSYHKFNEKERSIQIIERMKAEDLNVAVVSDAGTPGISDPGYEIVKSAHDNGIRVIGIPGGSAVITALSISGMDASSFVFKGFFPREAKEKEQLVSDMKNSKERIYVFYESPKRIIKFSEYMAERFPEANACFCSDLTKLHEKTITGNINEIYLSLKDDPESELGEYTVVIDITKCITGKEEETVEVYSIEAVLTDVMIKNKCTLKDAVNITNTNFPDISKKEVYQASLNLKQLFQPD